MLADAAETLAARVAALEHGTAVRDGEVKLIQRTLCSMIHRLAALESAAPPDRGCCSVSRADSGGNAPWESASPTVSQAAVTEDIPWRHRHGLPFYPRFYSDLTLEQ